MSDLHSYYSIVKYFEHKKNTQQVGVLDTCESMCSRCALRFIACTCTFLACAYLTFFLVLAFGLLTVFLEGFFNFGFVRYTFVGALRGSPNRLFGFTDTFFNETSCCTAVPSL